MPLTANSERFSSHLHTRLTIAFLVVTFLFGGGGREDIIGLVVLRPVAIMVLAVGLLGLTKDQWRSYQLINWLALACVALVIIHLIPLPPALWHHLPGRELIVRIDSAAGLGDVWRPLSLAPPMAWNALFATFVPLAGLVLAMRLQTEAHGAVVRALLAIGIASIVIGIAQLAGPPHGPLYFYSVTNEGALVGLFSNRNHHAVFLAMLLPVLAFLASMPARETGKLRLRLGLLASAALLIAAALLVTGSRTGILVGLAGALAALVLFRQPKVLQRSLRDSKSVVKAHREAWPLRSGRIVGMAIFAILFFLFLGFSNFPVVSRLLATGHAEELRFKVWRPIAKIAWSYFPFGSGAGSFADVYRIDEPTALLDGSYLNHAHNDWLEVILTMGLPGIILLAIAAAAWLVASRRVFLPARNPLPRTLLARLGSIEIGLLALASIADYPVRTPSLACFFAFAVVWLAQGVARPVDGIIEHE